MDSSACAETLFSSEMSVIDQRAVDWTMDSLPPFPGSAGDTSSDQVSWERPYDDALITALHDLRVETPAFSALMIHLRSERAWRSR